MRTQCHARADFRRESVPLEETVEAFESLVRAGKIRHWGVSNFDPSDMDELIYVPGGDDVETVQVLYNLTRRGVEYNLLPWCKSRSLPIMAYSPVEQGSILGNAVLQRIGREHEATSAQIALPWVLRQDSIIAIPKAAESEHVLENRKAIEVRLTEQDLAALDEEFPPPKHKMPLEML